MMLTVFNGDHLERDLEDLQNFADTANDVDLLNAFLDDVSEREDVLWKLLREKHEQQVPHFNCSLVRFFHNEGYNVYRIRPLTKRRLNKYRILYAYNAPANEIHFLAVVVKRSAPPHINLPSDKFYDYEANHPISIRIRSEYDNSSWGRI